MGIPGIDDVEFDDVAVSQDEFSLWMVPDLFRFHKNA